ncbi:MAG: hypothetical protein IT306_19745 [Chloroflexi bacterium]|nr:hypothetical protein [Chloroflexota bacterium]
MDAERGQQRESPDQLMKKARAWSVAYWPGMVARVPPWGQTKVGKAAIRAVLSETQWSWHFARNWHGQLIVVIERTKSPGSQPKGPCLVKAIYQGGGMETNRRRR